MRALIMVAAVLISVTAGQAVAKPCRDGKGKFAKCPPAAAAPARCKDAKGRFAKCSSAAANGAKH